ncbi:thioredoxin-like protein [Amanita rubescens]|nr:thioredoxin-like protein [Amanita rubescens]
MRFISFISFAFVAAVSASNVVELDTSNFDSIIGQGKPALVEFGHCKVTWLHVYEQLADAFANSKDKVVIAKVDADGNGKPLGQKYGVSGFPTLKWFSADGKDEPYEAGRDLDTLAAFVTQKSGVKSNIKPPPAPEYRILDYKDFDGVALVGAPWCGHCKTLKPIYNDVAKIFKSESNCIVANVDADDQKNKGIAERYDDAFEYKGGRTAVDFVKFLNEKCGTKRAAGRLPEFDSLAQKFFEAATDAKKAVYQEALSLAKNHYLKVMDKIVNGAAEYIEKESKRLESILKKRTLSDAKLDEIKVKFNVLRAFTQKEEKIGRAESEL